VIAAILVVGVISNLANGGKKQDDGAAGAPAPVATAEADAAKTPEATKTPEPKMVAVPNLVGKTVAEARAVQGIVIEATAGAADDWKITDQSQTGKVAEGTVVQVTAAQPVPAEYAAALRKADSYANIMHMSKAGLYDQLTSQYGEQFSPEAAQYAVDNVKTDWNANALAKAKNYQQSMSMSPAAIHDQLTSEYGEKFTPEEADYAIANLNS